MCINCVYDKMNKEGPEWCRLHRDKLVDLILPLVKVPGNDELTPRQLIGKCVDEAIRRSEAWETTADQEIATHQTHARRRFLAG